MHQREAALLFVGWSIVVLDLWQRGLEGDVNGRFLSFVDSLAHCASWVPVWGRPNDIGFWSRLLGSVMTKHGSGLVTSFFFGTTPTLLMGFEHNVPFLVALLFAHALRFVPRVVRTRQGPWFALFVLTSALYKLRKMHFAARRATSLLAAFPFGVLTMELTGWLAVVARGLARGRPLDQWAASFAQPRLIISVVVAVLAYCEYPPLLLLLLLVTHKFLAPFNETAILDPFDDSGEAAAADAHRSA